MKSRFLLLPLLAAAITATAQAQDITGLVVLLLPAVFLAPLISTAVKFFVISRLTPAGKRALRRDLVWVALLDFLLWEAVYPLGAPLELRFLSWWTTERYLLGGGLVVFLLVFLIHRRFLGRHWASGPGTSARYGSRLVLAGLTALTPLLVVLLSLAAFGLGNVL